MFNLAAAIFFIIVGIYVIAVGISGKPNPMSGEDVEKFDDEIRVLIIITGIGSLLLSYFNATE